MDSLEVGYKPCLNIEIEPEGEEVVEIVENEEVEVISVQTDIPLDGEETSEANSLPNNGPDSNLLDASNGQDVYVVQSDDSTGQAFVASSSSTRTESQTGEVLTLDQLTPSKLMELQCKGLIQIALDPPSLLRTPSWINEARLPLKVDSGPVLQEHEMCVVCGDRASGRHYGARTCEGCKGFFKRSVRKNMSYSCRGSSDCDIMGKRRNRCQYCRLNKCWEAGMKAESVQCERSPIIKNQHGYEHRQVSIKDAYSQSVGEGHGSLSTLANVVSTIAIMTNKQEAGDKSSSENGESGNVDGKTDLERALSNLSTTFRLLPPSSQKTPEFNFTSENIPVSPVLDFEGPLMTDSNFDFYVKKPLPEQESICEYASRLLFVSVQWTRNIFAFKILGSECHLALLRECWCELFACGLAQCSSQLKLNAIMASIVQHLHIGLKQEKISKERVGQAFKHIIYLRELVDELEKFNLDYKEFAYLKIVLLLCPDHVRPSKKPQVHEFRSKVLAEFRAYEEKIHPQEHERLQNLLLKLPALRGIDGGIMEELFFAGLINNVAIDSIIPLLLAMKSTEYSFSAEGAGDDPAGSNLADTGQIYVVDTGGGSVAVSTSEGT